MPIRATEAAVSALRRRRDAAAAARAARETGIPAAAVGGAVRDAFLGREGGDLDLAVDAGRAAAFAGRLAALLGARVVAVGAAPRRILRIPAGRHEVDVWEVPGGREEDVLRRDFTVNALRVELPGWTLTAPEGALDDLASGRLRPPRPGVFREDPLRVLRAARFEATLPGFRLWWGAVPEAVEASGRLAATPAERRLAELDRLLRAEPRRAAAALLRLESWGALRSLLPRLTSGQLRRGAARAGRLARPDPPTARALLVSGAHAAEAEASLCDLRVPTREVRLAARLLSLPRRRRREPTPRDVARLLRSAAPWVEQALLFLEAAGDAGTRELVRAARAVASSRRSLENALAPRRPLSAQEVARELGVPPGPALGAALDRLDLALAAGEVRGEEEARAFLRRLARRLR